MAAVKRAVIVGINDYRDKAIPALKGAERDAKEIRDILTKKGDFIVADNHFLVGPAATHEAVVGSISDLLWKTDRNDVALFYFSGHGIADSYGSGYLAPYDMVKQQPLIHGIEMQGLRELALKSKNKAAVVMILDCCYAGVAADAKGPIEAVDAAEKIFSGMSEAERAKDAAEGVFILSSSAADETSRELSGCQHKLGEEELPHEHGAFTFQLIEGLSGLAAGSEELVSVETLRDYVGREGKNPNQTFKLFSSRESNAGRIVLARATDAAKLEDTLVKIKEDLSADDYQSWILAADSLSRVLGSRPNYQPAKSLRGPIEEKLGVCRQTTLRWFNANRLPMMQQSRSVCERLHGFVINLNLEQIIKSQRDTRDDTLGLVVAMVDLAQNDLPVATLLPQLQASERPLTPLTSQVGKKA